MFYLHENFFATSSTFSNNKQLNLIDNYYFVQFLVDLGGNFLKKNLPQEPLDLENVKGSL